MFSTDSLPCRGRRLSLSLALAVALSCVFAGRFGRAGQVDLSNAHLSDLLVPGNFAIVGNERVDTFTFTGSPSTLLPNPANIIVSATSSGSGLDFNGGPFLTIGNQTLDASLTFDVTALDPMKPITMAELNLVTAAASGGGAVTILETVRGAMNQVLGSQLVIAQQNMAQSDFSATMTFAPQTTIQVSKDIILVGNQGGTTNPVNVAGLSDFNQIFDPTPVPEPSSIAMAAIGSGGIGWFGWRRKRKKSSTKKGSS